MRCALRPTAPGRRSSRDGKVLGSREVQTRSTHCDAIDEKLSLVVSVLIDPDGDAGVREADEPPPAALPVPPTVVERERVVVVHDAPPPAPQRLRFELAVAAGGLAGLQPDVGAALVPSVLVAPPHFWPILLSGGIGASTTSDTVRGANANVSLAYGALALCPLEAERGRVRAMACAGVLVGALRSTGIGFDTTASASSLVAGPVLDGRVTLTIAGPLLALLAVDVVVPISRPEVGYTSPAGESTLFETGAVGAIGSLGLGVKLP